MPMHADTIAALRAGATIVHLVTVEMPDAYTIRWTDGGVVKWGSDTYRAKDATFGSLRSIGDITDGIEVDAAPVTVTIMPPSLSSMADLTAADAQGGAVEIHLVALVDGVIEGEPYLLFKGELDQPSLQPGEERLLTYAVIPAEARALRTNEEQRQTDAFHQLRWPGEMGQQFATEGTKLTYWREDDKPTALGVAMGRGSKDPNDKAIEYTYEPRAPFAFPFGRVGIAGGEMRYRAGYDATNRFQTTVNTIAASGPIQGLVSVAFDDEVTTFDGNDKAQDGEHENYMWFSFLPGDQPSAALTKPTGPEAPSASLPGWTTDHKLSGSAAYMWTGKENSKKSEFNGGIPKPLLVIDGLLGYDPTDVASEIDDPTTWTFLDEGCRVALNWTIGRWEGDSGGGAYGVPYLCTAVGGLGVPLDMIDVDGFADAAEIADTNGWKFAGVAYSDEDRVDVLEDMLAASGARRSRRAGQLSCVSLAAPKASSLTVTDADTAGSPDITLRASRLDRVNTGIPEFLSGEHRWEIIGADPVGDPAWITADGGRNTATFTYRFCPDKDQAAQLCYLDMARNRAGVQGEATFQPWMLELEPGDTFVWDEAEFLLTDVKCRVWTRTYSPSSALVSVEFREELSDAEYTAALGETGTVPAPGDPTSPPTDVVDPPTGASISVSGDEVTINWTNGDARFFRTLIFQSPTSSFAGATQVASKGGDPEAAQTAVLKPGPGEWWFWLQTRSGGIGADDVSDEVALGSVTVGGPAAATIPGLGDLAEKDTVETADIEPNNITDHASAVTTGTLAWSGSGYDVAQTVSLTTTGGRVEIQGSMTFSGSSASQFNAFAQVERDGVVVWGPFTVAEAWPTTSFSSYNMTIPFFIALDDEPAAGAHTWDLKFSFGSTGGARNVRARSLSVREMKTEV